MRNKVSSEVRLETTEPCRKCSATTVEVINNPPTSKDKLTLKCTGCDRKISGNSLSLLLLEWEESNKQK